MIEKGKEAVVLIVLLAAIFLIFSGVLNAGFLNWDDTVHVTKNDSIRSLSAQNIQSIFTTSTNQTYIPLTIFSFAVEYYFFGLNPLIYHLDNLLLHLVVVALIFLFARQIGLNLSAAAMAALLFGIHPMHVESVAWVTERKDMLYALFYMLSLFRYCEYLHNHKKIDYWLSLLFGTLSILAKPMALSLPLVLFLFDWFFKRRWSLGVLYDKIAYGLIFAPIAWMTLSKNIRGFHVDFYEGLLSLVWSATFYIQKFFFPLHLTPIYPIPRPTSIIHLPYLISLAVFVLIALSLFLLKKNRWLRFAFFYYILSIFFMLRIDTHQDSNVVADRFMYLPSLGICLWVGLGAGRVLERIQHKGKFLKMGTTLAIILLFFSLTIKTQNQIKIWKDGIALWNRVIEYSPKSAKAHNNRGQAYHEAGEFDLALKDYDRAILLDETLVYPYLNRAIIYKHLGLFEEAEQDLMKASSLEEFLKQSGKAD